MTTEPVKIIYGPPVPKGLVTPATPLGQGEVVVPRITAPLTPTQQRIEAEYTKWTSLSSKAYTGIQQAQYKYELLQQPTISTAFLADVDTPLGAEPIWKYIRGQYYNIKTKEYVSPDITGAYSIGGRRYKAYAVGEVKKQLNQVRTELLRSTSEFARADFISKAIYNVMTDKDILGSLVAGQLDIKEMLTALASKTTDVTQDDLTYTEELLQEVVDSYMVEPELPEMAKEAERLKLEKLVKPLPEPKPIGLMRITVESIKHDLAAPRVPDQVMTNEEWQAHLELSNAVDLDMKSRADQLIKKWQDDIAQVEAFKNGMAELPEYKFRDIVKEMVITPAVVLGEVYMEVAEHVAQPIAGTVWKTFIPDIESAYQKYRKEGSTHREALVRAWQGWEAPGASNWFPDWILKYVLMEGLLDPLTYIGWQIPGKIVKPLGAFGRVANSLSAGFAEMMSLPFDGVKALWEAVPKSIIGESLLKRSVTGQYYRHGAELWLLKQAEKTGTLKSFRAMTNEEMRAYQRQAIGFAFRHPIPNNTWTMAGQDILLHKPFTLEQVEKLAKAVKSGFSVTDDSVFHINELFEEYFTKRNISSIKAASLIAGKLELSSDEAVKGVRAWIKQQASNIYADGMKFADYPKPVKGMMALMERNHTYTEESLRSTVAIRAKQLGRVAALFDEVKTTVGRVWTNTIDRMITRPVAVSYLTYGMYGPMNVVEAVIRTVLGGVMPGRKSVAYFEAKHFGLNYHPDIVMRKGISETMGVAREIMDDVTKNSWMITLSTALPALPVYGATKLLAGKQILGKTVEAVTPEMFARGTKFALNEFWNRIDADMRRHFLDARFDQILLSTGGDEVKALVKATTRFRGTADEALNKEVTRYVEGLVLSGNPDAIRGARTFFTMKNIQEKEVRNRIMKYNNLSPQVRNFWLDKFREGELFSEVPKMPGIVDWSNVRFGSDIPLEFQDKFRKIIDGVPDVIKAGFREVMINKNQTLVAGYYPKLGRMSFNKWSAMGEPDIVYHELAHSMIDLDNELLTAYGRVRGVTLRVPRVLEEDFAVDFSLYLQGKTSLHDMEPATVKFFSERYPRSKFPVADSIDMTHRDSLDLVSKSMLDNPDLATKQIKLAVDDLTSAGVRNPEELASVLRDIQVISDTYDMLPKEVIAKASKYSRGLPYENRNPMVNKALDDVARFRQESAVELNRLMDNLKIEVTKAGATPDYVSATNNLLNTHSAKSAELARVGTDFNEWRKAHFATATKAQLDHNEGLFWDRFYDAEDTWQYRVDRITSKYDTMIGEMNRGIDQIAGISRPPRNPVVVQGRPLAPADIASLLEVRMNDITSNLFDLHVIQRDREKFIDFVMDRVKDTDKGFTRETVGQVYDQIVFSLTGRKEVLDMTSSQVMELEALRQDMHNFYNGKRIKPEDVEAIGSYADETATRVKKLGINSEAFLKVRQSAMDEAHKYLYREFTDYTSTNFIDDMMKMIYPFWCVPEYATILTKAGWKHYLELVIGEDVLVVDPKTFTTRWEPLQEVATFDYNDNLMVIPAKGKNIKFTPNHRWLTVNKSGISSIKRGRELTDYDMIPRALPHEFPEDSILNTRDAAILGWMLTDGLDYTVIAKHKDSDRILAICPTKDDAIKIISQLSKQSAEAMWDAMFKAEGNLHIEYTGMENRSFTQNPGTVMQTFQLLSILLGKAITVNSHRVNILNNTKPYNAKECRRMHREHYTGKVWCPVTPSGTWFMNCNGSVVPTGNTYESRRWYWLPRAMVRHPVVFTTLGKYINESDDSYLHIPGTSIEVNPFRGTVFGPLVRTSVNKNRSYYESLPGGALLAFNENVLQRYGFYPGAPWNIILTMISDARPHLGEIMPPTAQSILDVMAATFPDNKLISFVSDKIFSNRFKDYLTLKEVTRRGGDGALLGRKIRGKEELTEEEQRLYKESRSQMAWYSAGFEQFGLFKFKPEEQLEIEQVCAEAIYEMTGFTPDQQEEMRDRGLRIWDYVGGMSYAQQATLEALGYWKYAGISDALLGDDEQAVADSIAQGWTAIENYTKNVTMPGQLDIQKDFLNGILSPDDYNLKLRELYDDKTAYIDNKVADNPLMLLENRADYYKDHKIAIPVLHPMKELIALYFSIELTQKYNPDTGQREDDWDTFYAEKDAIDAAIPDNLKQEWEDYLSKNQIRLEEVRRTVYDEYFSKYYGVWDSILKRYSPEEQRLINEYLSLAELGTNISRQELIQAMVGKDGRQLISGFKSDVSSAKEALRFANPALDAWLRYWGKTGSFLTPEARTIYNQLLLDTGRKGGELQ